MTLSQACRVTRELLESTNEIVCIAPDSLIHEVLLARSQKSLNVIMR